MSEYSEQTYWDGRYQLDTEPYEWYQPFSTLRPYIAPLLNPVHRHIVAASPSPTTTLRRIHQPSRRASNAADEQPPVFDRPPSAADSPLVRVLVLGCGCSEVSAEVWRMAEGRAEVHSVDFSVQCIEEMRRRYPMPNLHFHLQDVRGLTFPADYFDLVIDKATLDCLHCLDTTDGATQLKLAVQCLHRVMRVDATLLSVSHAPPEQRSSHFMLDRLEVMKTQLEVEKKEKAMRRVGATTDTAGAITSPPGSKHSTPMLVNRRASMSGSRRGSRRSSMINTIDAMSVALLTQPVVHRLAKPVSPEGADDSQSRALTRTSSVASVTASTSSITSSPLQQARRTSLLMDTIALPDSSTTDRNADDELSALYDNSDHYLYIVHKEMVAPTPQAQGLRTVNDTAMAGGKRSSLVGLPGHGRRMSAIGLATTVETQ